MPRRPFKYATKPQILLTSLQIDPKYSKSYARLGDCYVTKRDYAAAVQAYKDGLAVEPTSQNLVAGLENAKRLQGKQATSGFLLD